MNKNEIGCCGAYCKTCKAYKTGAAEKNGKSDNMRSCGSTFGEKCQKNIAVTTENLCSGMNLLKSGEMQGATSIAQRPVLEVRTQASAGSNAADCRFSAGVGGCKGCKSGYLDGSRDVNKIKCAIKRCCLLEKKLASCAECTELENCAIVNGFYNKNGHKYRKYRESILYIREHGYEKFMSAAEKWTNAYGKLK